MKAPVDTVEVDAAVIATGRMPYTGGLSLKALNFEPQRGFAQVDEHMCVLDRYGMVFNHMYAVGDVNGKMMLAHAASVQGILTVKNICGTPHFVDHDAVPAACFMHSEISMVGLTGPSAQERATV